MDHSAPPTLHVTAAVAGSGYYKSSMSGGDRIAIHLAKEWLSSVGPVVVYTTPSGRQTYENRLTGRVSYVILDEFVTTRRNLWATLLFELRALLGGFRTIHSRRFEDTPAIIYAPSHFWPDLLTAILLKRRMPKSELIATMYLFPPSPFSKDSPYKGRNVFNGLFYFISHFGVISLFKRYAGMIWVSHEYDQARIRKSLNDGRIPVVVAPFGVDLPRVEGTAKADRTYAGVFIGRLHPQKGVDKLIQLWKQVVALRPLLRLAIIGDGPLEEELRRMIRDYGLTENIDLLGYLDGEAKYAVINQSRVVFYMSTLEVFAMAPIEAMAAGLPCVAIDAPGRRGYFSMGTVLVSPNQSHRMAQALLQLLDSQTLYQKLSGEARDLASGWAWEARQKAMRAHALGLIAEQSKLSR